LAFGTVLSYIAFRSLYYSYLGNENMRDKPVQIWIRNIPQKFADLPLQNEPKNLRVCHLQTNQKNLCAHLWTLCPALPRALQNAIKRFTKRLVLFRSGRIFLPVWPKSSPRTWQQCTSESFALGFVLFGVGRHILNIVRNCSGKKSVNILNILAYPRRFLKTLTGKQTFIKI
jgi:hypothetical protein